VRLAIVTAVFSGALGAVGAFAFVHAFTDNSLGATAATLNDFSNAVLGLLVGLATTTFVASLLRPTHATVRYSVLAAGLGYLAIDVPIFALTSDDAGAALWLTLLGLPVVVVAGAFGAILGRGMGIAVGPNRAGSG
jgi:hypothetical protein